MDAYHRHTVTHADHPVAAPLSDRAVAVVLDRAVARDGTVRLLDLGCGEAVWLRRALAARPGATAVGIDLDEPGLAVGRRAAEREGVGDRLRLVREDAALHVSDRPAGTVLCVGATHAFGGLLPALEAAHGHLADGGTVVVGEGFWEREPEAAALAALGCGPDAYDDLPGTVRRVTDAGWVPVYGHVSTAEEWDDYEWSWTGALARWALDHPDHPSAAEAAATAREHRDAWLGGYRGTLGFLTLTLRRAR